MIRLSLEKPGFEIISIHPIVTVNAEIYEVKYTYDEVDIFQIGMLKRFASYITAVARTNLFRMIINIEQNYKQARVVYADTDSVFVDISAGFDER